MYARFTEATIDPKQRAQAENIAKSIFEAARKQKGFKGVSFALDSKGEGVFLSLWDSKDALEANEQSGYYNEQVAKLKGLLTKPTVRHIGEIKAHEDTHKSPKVARLTITAMRSGTEEQSNRLIQDVARAARNEPGFIAWYGVQTDNRKTAAISFWESLDAMKQTESRYLKDALGKLKELSTSPAQPKTYEIVGHDVPAVAGVR